MSNDPTIPTAPVVEDDVDPWAMQIVVRVEKTNPPTTSALCAATGLAVARFIASATGTDLEALRAWEHGRIRKLVRRARGAAWDALDVGTLYTHDDVMVRVLAPSPKSLVSADVARLQVEGLRLADPDRLSDVVDPSDSVVVYVNPEWGLEHHPGKTAAQVAHATQLALASMDVARQRRFFATPAPVVVSWPSPDTYRALRTEAPVVITDAGFTVLPRPGETVIAYW